MKKKSVALLLSLTMVAGLLPSAAFASTEQLSSVQSDAEEPAESVPNEVLVLYEAGEVSTEESGGQASVKTGKTFGTRMTGIETAKSAQRETAEDLNNSLYDQAAILKDSLGSDFVIEDTVIFGDEDASGISLQEEGADAADSLVISLVRSDSLSAEEMAARLGKNPAVRAAEPNYIYQPLAAAGSGEYMDFTWHLEDSGDKDASIHVTDMWNSLGEASGDDVVVAVLDTGVDYTHEELADHMWVNDTDDSSLKGVYGYDFCDRDGDPMDEEGHGTHCAGIIAADGQNEAGVAGVASAASNVKIMALRFLGEWGGTEADAIGAYYYIARAKEAGVNIRLVSNSWGGPGSCEVFNAVVEKLGKESGVLSVFAAGNDGVNNDYTESSPANLTSDYGITVAATNENGELAGYSQYGRKTVDIGAPGNILSSVSYNNYAPWLYKADKVAQLSEYYGEFSADQEITKDENGQDTITPVLGTDIDGTAITGVKEFGPVRLFSQSDLGGEGKGTMSLSLSDEKTVNRSDHPACLKWHITGATLGETYFLYLPIEMNPAWNEFNSYFTMPWQVSSDAETETGIMWCGEIGKRPDGKYEIANGGGFYARRDYKDVWAASQMAGLVAGNMLEGFSYVECGIGFMYEAGGEGDVDLYVDSFGIAKPAEDTTDFGKYDLYSGTSMATPVVSGSLALLAAKYPDASPLDLKAMLFATADDSLQGYVSTGGKVDFSNIDYEAEPAAAFAPAVTGSSVNSTKRTVTLKGQHFGTEKGSITYELPVRAPGESFTVAEEDITTWTDTKIVFKDNTEGKGLIDSDGRVCVTAASGKTGEFNAWFVKGEKGFTFYAQGDSLNGEEFFFFGKDLTSLKYDKAYDSDDDYDYDYDDEEEEEEGTSKLTPITDGTRFLGVDESGELHEIKKGFPADDFDDEFDEDISAPEDGEDSYYTSSLESYWTVVGTEEDLETWKANDWEKAQIEVTPLTNAVWMKGVIYEWLCVNLGDRDIYVLAGYNVASDTWKTYYCSYGAKTSEIPIPLTDKGECYADIRLAAAGGMLYWTNGLYLDWSGWFDIEIYLNRTMYSFKPSDPASMQKYEDVFPEDLLGGKLVNYKNKLYYLLGFDLNGGRNMTVYCWDAKNAAWTATGSLPAIVESIASMDDEEDCAVGICDKGIVLSGLAFDGYGDTIVLDPADPENPDKIISSGRSIFGETPNTVVRGLVIGSKLNIYYDCYEDEGETKYGRIETLNLSVMDCASAYSTIKKAAGKGSAISGTDSYLKGETASLTVKAKKGYYIRSVTVDGTAAAKAKGVTVSTNTKAKVSLKFKTSKDTHIVKSVMGKYATRVTITRKVTKLAAGKSTTLKATTNGTNKKVSWKVSNTKYASITAAGKLTAKAAGKGKTVTVTATAKDGSKKAASIKVKIS